MPGDESSTLALVETPRVRPKPPGRRTVRDNPEKIPPAAFTAAQLLARGTPVKTVAKMLKRAEATIRTWEEVYQDLIIQAAREIASPQDALVPMIPKALRVIQDRLTEPTDNAADRGIQLAAAHDVLDRSWGKAVQRSIVDSRQSIHVSFAPPVGTEIIDSGPAADSAADD